MPWIHKKTQRGTISEHDHTVTEVKSFPRWKASMRTKHRDADGNTYYKPISVTKRSEMNHLHAANQVKRHMHFLWQSADQAPYFRQPIIRVPDKETGKLPAFKKGKKGPITTRANRALSGHTLRTIASGAAAAVGAQLAADCALLRIEDTTPEDAKYPIQPVITVGAAMAIEAGWISFNQWMFRTAVDIQQAHKKKHSKVTAKCAQAAAEIVCRQLAGGTSFVPNQVRFRKKLTKKKAKAGQEAGAAAKPPKGFAKKTGGKP